MVQGAKGKASKQESPVLFFETQKRSTGRLPSTLHPNCEQQAAEISDELPTDSGLSMHLEGLLDFRIILTNCI